MNRATIDSYYQYYVSLNPWALRRPSTAGEVRSGMELLGGAELRDTEFNFGWFQPRGWLHAASVVRAYALGPGRPSDHPAGKPPALAR
jgi:hypothetical protein